MKHPSICKYLFLDLFFMCQMEVSSVVLNAHLSVDSQPVVLFIRVLPSSFQSWSKFNQGRSFDSKTGRMKHLGKLKTEKQMPKECYLNLAGLVMWCTFHVVQQCRLFPSYSRCQIDDLS